MHSGRVAVLALLAIGFAAPVAHSAKVSAPPTAFDLDCVMKRVGRHVRPVTPRKHFRIDLDRHLWCEDRCEDVRGLDVDEDALTLSTAEEKSADTAAVTRRSLTISRRTADVRDERHLYLNGDLVGDDLIEGRCRLRPYSGVDKKLF